MTCLSPDTFPSLVGRTSQELRYLASALRGVEEKLEKAVAHADVELDACDRKALQDIDRVIQSLDAISDFLSAALSDDADPDNKRVKVALDAISLRDLRDRLAGAPENRSSAHQPELF